MAIGTTRPSPEACPASELLAEYLERSLQPRDRASVEAHLVSCADCRGVLTDAAADLEAEGRPLSNWPGTVSRWPGRPVLAIAGTLAAAAAIVLLLRVVTYNGSQPESATPFATAPQTVVADPNRQAVSRLAQADAEAVTRALDTMRLDVPPSALALGGRRGVMRGSGDAERPRLRDPLATYVSSTRPAFRWDPVADAQYEVTVFEAAGGQAATSGWITEPQWVPAIDLAPGAAYTWQLAAKRGSNVVRTPTLAEPEARFRILTADESREVAATRQKAEGAPVVAAILMARAGLLAEAEALLTETAALPDAPENARQLLVNLQSVRRGDSTR